MTDNEQKTTMISIYMNLLRISQAEDRDKEIRNQLREARAKLEAYGIPVDDLTIE